MVQVQEEELDYQAVVNFLRLPLGNIYLTGTLADGTLLSRYDSSGMHSWSYKRGVYQLIISNSPVLDEEGGITITGTQYESTSHSIGKIFIEKINNKGEPMWRMESKSNYLDSPLSLSRCPSGDIYVGGLTTSDPVILGNISLPDLDRSMDALIVKVNNTPHNPLRLSFGRRLCNLPR